VKMRTSGLHSASQNHPLGNAFAASVLQLIIIFINLDISINYIKILVLNILSSSKRQLCRWNMTIVYSRDTLLTLDLVLLKFLRL